MSQSLKNLGSKLDDLSRAGGVLVNEGADVIVLSSLSAADATEVATLTAEAQLTWHGEHGADGALSKDEGFDSALEPFRLTVKKPSIDGAAVLFTLEGLRQWLERDNPPLVLMHVQTGKSFSTVGRHFLAWGDNPTKDKQVERRPNPRNLVRESGEPTVPARIEPWLLDMPLSHMPLGDVVFDEWARLSVQIAGRCLASEILADGTIVYAGPPKLKVDGRAERPVSKELLFQFQRALRWVYETDHQAEIRHGLMGAELSRHAIDGGLTPSALEAAVEGAKIAYQLSLSEISRDSLRAIADVRKAVTEEINKTADTARQLATAVAGAVFLGLGVVAARVTSSAPPAILISLSIVLAAYVGAIIYASTHFMGLQERLRSDWKQRFFNFLGTDDYKTLVTDPLHAAKRGFVVVAWIAGLISAAMVIGVIVLMTFDFSSPESNSQQPAATTTQSVPEHGGSGSGNPESADIKP